MNVPNEDRASTIKKNVRLIVSQCEVGEALYRFSDGQMHVPILKMGLDKPPEVETFDRLSAYQINNEHIEMLRILYQTANEDEKKVVLDTCWEACFSRQSAATVFTFLLRYHSFKWTLNLLVATPDTHFLRVASVTLPALAQVLRFDHAFIPREELETASVLLTKRLLPLRPKGTMRNEGFRPILAYSIEETKQLDKYEPVEKLINYTREQITRIQYLRLRKELRESANFEINQDREKLLDHLSSLGFTAKLTEFLKFAEVEFAKAQDAFSYKTSVDQIRSFFAELLNETAEKIAARRGESLAAAHVDTKYPVKVREYLSSTGFFSDQFKTLVDGLYKFMSDEGTHTLGATKDVARIARNIAIEIGLLITKRLDQPKAGVTP